jgi:hypothetical protein
MWFAEAYRRPDTTAWLSLMNPLRTAQDVRVEVVGQNIVRTVRVAPRSRQAAELGAWGAAGEFGVEVTCDPVCAAALVLWDRNYQRPNTSVPVLGCEVP